KAGLENAALARVTEAFRDLGRSGQSDPPHGAAAHGIARRSHELAQEVVPVFGASEERPPFRGGIAAAAERRNVDLHVRDRNHRQELAQGVPHRRGLVPNFSALPGEDLEPVRDSEPDRAFTTGHRVYPASSTPRSRSFCSSSAIRTSRGSVMVIPRQVPRATLLSG